jgi:hypothetical protein
MKSPYERLSFGYASWRDHIYLNWGIDRSRPALWRPASEGIRCRGGAATSSGALRFSIPAPLVEKLIAVPLEQAFPA